MVDVWAVIGDDKARKTSTIRALTGVWRRERRWEVDFGAGPEPTFVEPSALQERKFKPQLPTMQQRANRLISDVRSARVSRVIIALRYKHLTFGDADAYLTFLANAGWNVKGHSVLGAWPLLSFPAGVLATNSKKRASNEIAALCRRAWGIR